MTTRITRRQGKNVEILTGTLALSLGVSLVPVAPVYATDPPVTADKQDYYKCYKPKSICDQGITGEDVTIVILGDAMNPDIPELKGTNIQDRMPCVRELAPKNAVHDTTVAQILVSPEFGMVSDATLYIYTIPLYSDKSNCTLSGWTGETESNTPLPIKQVVNDGVDIITISSNFPTDPIDLRWATTRAFAESAIVMTAIGNETTKNLGDSFALWREICDIGVTACYNILTEYTNWGNGLLTTVLGTVLTCDASTSCVEKTRGTSFAAPIIAGFLVLDWQHLDGDVSADQVLQALAVTGRGGDNWSKLTGYGPTDPVAFLRSGPSQYADEDPCVPQVYDSLPSRDDVVNYADDVVNPILTRNDDIYVCHGVNEETILSREHGYPTHIGTSPWYHGQ